MITYPLVNRRGFKYIMMYNIAPPHKRNFVIEVISYAAINYLNCHSFSDTRVAPNDGMEMG